MTTGSSRPSRASVFFALLLPIALILSSSKAPWGAEESRMTSTERLSPPSALSTVDTINVYGPRAFATENGSAQYHIEQFQLSLIEGASYTMRVDNGDGAGSLRATATVKLNGDTIFSATDIHSGVATVSQVVIPDTLNTLEVTVEGQDGSHVTVTIWTLPSPDYTVYGPEQFARTGSPTTETRAFSIPSTASAPHKLYIINGASDGSNRVTAGRVWLNGVEIVTHSEFGNSVATITKTVTLLLQDTLQVRVDNEVGSYMTVRFTATDTTAPNLTVSSPTEGAVIGATEAEVTGTVIDETPTQVTVNGYYAVVSGTSWSVTVPLAQEGSNALEVVATDAAGHESTTTRNVIRDAEPPSLTVTSPTDGLVTNVSSVTVAGSAIDQTSVTVNVNGTPLSVDGSGNFSDSYALSEGSNVLTVTATNAGSQGSSVIRMVTLDTVAPSLTVNQPQDSMTTSADSVVVSGTVVDSTDVIVSINGTNVTVVNGAFSGSVSLEVGSNTITVTATDEAGNVSTVFRHVTRSGGPELIAPPIDPSEMTTMAAATAFLYSGENPIQVDVNPDTIDPLRVAVLRGKVLDQAGAALAGARVEIADHPEFGHTLSRTDGAYDLAVNGGGPLTLHYTKTGYLPAQRPAETPIQAFLGIDDVVLLEPDTLVSTIDFSEAIEVARGTPQTDEDGTRQATLFFPQGAQASMTLSDSSTQGLSELSVRATEFTVGDRGRNAMPAPLPPTSAYTYAVELTVDEAVSAGATDVTFSQPVPFYVENFLGFPVGMDIPVGRYDFQKEAWISETDGRVIKIVSISGGLANVDITGDGIADDGSVIGITSDERERLASTYTSGTALWRAPLTHFSPLDLNFPKGAPSGASPPPAPPRSPDPNDDEPCKSQGSIIECQNQALGERIPVLGTPWSLNYRSDRVPGRASAYSIDILITGATVHPDLQRIELTIEVAGRVFADTFPPNANQSTSFTWDGFDAYGRQLQGAQPIRVRIANIYPFYYGVPASTAESFGLSCTSSPLSACVIPTTINSDARQEEAVELVWEGSIGAWQAVEAGLGGWSLDVHHMYDPFGTVLYRGDGGRETGERVGIGIIETVAGKSGTGVPQDGDLATESALILPADVVVAPDNSYYISDELAYVIWKVGTDGRVTRFAGTYASSTYSGDGGQARSAKFRRPTGLALGPDGSLYIADRSDHRVRRVAPNGIISTFAGNGVSGSSGDGGPATSAAIKGPWDVAVGPDGSVYISEVTSNKIRRVMPDGTIYTVAGTGSSGTSGDGGPATAAKLYWPEGIDVGEDGSLYIATYASHQIRKVGPDGVISTVAGIPGQAGFTGDGGGATLAKLRNPQGLAVGSGGAFHVVDNNNYRIRRVDPTGVISTVVGSGPTSPSSTGGFGGDGGPVTAALINNPSQIDFGPDGSLYIADTDNKRIRRVRGVLPKTGLEDYQIPSTDGSQVYSFSPTGRHLLTRDALTGAALYSFSYDSLGLLASVTDASGNVTLVERNSSGTPTAIVAPFGQRTELTLNADRYLASVTNPANESVMLGYDPGGLLASLTDPRSNVHEFSYDSLGRLSLDEDPAGGYTQLSRTELANGFEVTKTTALGRVTTYRTEDQPIGDQTRLNTSSSGQAYGSTIAPDGTVTTTLPDSTIVTNKKGPDPRFGMNAPLLQSLTTTTPGGLTSTLELKRVVTLSTPGNPLSLQTQTDSITVNGRLFTRSYDASQRRYTSVSAAGRVNLVEMDSLGRVVWDSTGGLLAVRYTYDTAGRLSQIAQGPRSWSYTYDSSGRLVAVDDPLGRRDSVAYDAAGRATSQILPGGSAINMSYDPNGTVTGVTPPGGSQHQFAYTATGLMASYTPPDLGPGVEATTYAYNLDRQLTRITRPDSLPIEFAYNAGGRLDTLSVAGGAYEYGYAPGSGKVIRIDGPYADSLSFGYDGSLMTSITWSGPVAGSVSLGYDADYRVAVMRVNGADSIGFGYDADGLLTQAGALSLNRGSSHGLVTGTTLGSMTTTQDYTGFGEPSEYRAQYSGSDLLHASYVRDSLGRISQLTETVQGTTKILEFDYDETGRLIEVRTDSVTTATYGYDDNGNRIQASGPGGTVTGSYDDQDRPLSYGSASYSHTPNGELARKVVGADTTFYSYDELGNLTSVRLPNGTQIDYVIDGLNRRVGKKVDGSLVQGWLYQDQLNPVAEIDSAGQVIARFVYGLRTNVPEYMIKSGVTYRFVTDHLGSVRMVVNTGTGAVTQRLDYDAFGHVVVNTNPGFQPFGFGGGLFDSESNLVRFGVRDYSGETGRWTAKDPLRVGLGHGSLYSYSQNDPVNISDPTGLAPIPQCAKDFYAPFFPGLNLDQIEIGDVSWLSWLFGDRARGLTVDGTTILFRDPFDPTTKGDFLLLGHELIHIRQYNDLGKIMFRVGYGLELLYGHGFLTRNYFEREAYGFQDALERMMLDSSPCAKRNPDPSEPLMCPA